ncbi:MAG: flagellar hook-length control protein FliK [Paracoccaceae bacterium]
MCSAITNHTGLQTTGLKGGEKSSVQGDQGDVFSNLFKLLNFTDTDQVGEATLVSLGIPGTSNSVDGVDFTSMTTSEIENLLGSLTQLKSQYSSDLSEPQLAEIQNEMTSFDLISGKLYQLETAALETADVSSGSSLDEELFDAQTALSKVLEIVERLRSNKQASLTVGNVDNVQAERQFSEVLGNNLDISDLHSIFRRIPDLDESKPSSEIKINLEKLTEAKSSDDDVTQIYKVYLGDTESEEVSLLAIDIINDEMINVSQTTLSGIEDLNLDRSQKIIDVRSNVQSDPILVDHNGIGALIVSIEHATSKTHSPKDINLHFQRADDQIQSPSLHATNVDTDVTVEDIDHVVINFKGDQKIQIIHSTVEVASEGSTSDLDNQKTVVRDLALPVGEKFKALLDRSAIIEQAITGLDDLRGKISRDAIRQQLSQQVDNVLKTKKRNTTAGLASKSSKSSLFLTTADVLSLRSLQKRNNIAMDVMNKSLDLKMTVFDHINQTHTHSNKENSPGQINIDTTMSRDVILSEALTSNIKTTTMKSQAQQIQQAMQPTTTFGNQLNLLDAQFTSRLAAYAVEQALNNADAVELHLEPKSFGKLQVNATLETNGLDVKLVAENSATMAILRGSEALLGNIAEQHGLKLSTYTVDMSSGNNQNNNDQGQENQRPQDQNAGNVNDDSTGGIEQLVDNENNLLNLIA